MRFRWPKPGTMVCMDPNNGKVLGICSYPSFDLSIFEGTTVDPGGWSEIAADERNPMFNRAISSKDSPGSIFKLVTSLGGLSEGAITLTERISDEGEFYREGTDTSYKPRCWIGESKRYSTPTRPSSKPSKTAATTSSMRSPIASAPRTSPSGRPRWV